MEWSTQDIERAAKEGWKRANGFVTRTFDAHGRSAFSSDMQLVLHLYRNGFSSEWHREAFVSLPWTGAHDELALHEGWCLGRDSTVYTRAAHKGLKTHEAAAAFVTEQALQGNPLCMKAAATIAKRRLLSGG